MYVESPSSSEKMQGNWGRSSMEEPTYVDIQPMDAVTRRLVRWDGMAVEVVQATRWESLAFGYRGAYHMLVVCGDGLRRDGATLVEGLPRSTLRGATRRLT